MAHRRTTTFSSNDLIFLALKFCTDDSAAMLGFPELLLFRDNTDVRLLSDLLNARGGRGGRPLVLLVTDNVRLPSDLLNARDGGPRLLLVSGLSRSLTDSGNLTRVLFAVLPSRYRLPAALAGDPPLLLPKLRLVPAVHARQTGIRCGQVWQDERYQMPNCAVAVHPTSKKVPILDTLL